MSRHLVQRNWRDARARWDCPVCIVCGTSWNVELAHTAGRTHDRPTPVHERVTELLTGDSTGLHLDPRSRGEVLYVDPLDVVPLCGPATTTGTCHQQYDDGELDLLPYLNLAQQIALVFTMGGIEAARNRACGVSVTGRRAA